jgi:hypothetical protein
MRSTSSDIFHTRSALHPSSLTARRGGSIRVGNWEVGDRWCSTITGYRYGTRGMEVSSWMVASPTS